MLCWWLDLEGVQATRLPLAWGAAAVEVQGLMDPHPPFCVPLLTTQHPQQVEPKQVGSEGRLGTSLIAGSGCVNGRQCGQPWTVGRVGGIALGCVFCGCAGP